MNFRKLIDFISRLPIVNKYNRYIIERDSIKYAHNLNIDLAKISQPRVLISYLNTIGNEILSAQHANVLHANQIIEEFIKHGYIVDVCRFDNERAIHDLSKNKYDVVFGFGKAFISFCHNNPLARKILFLTENNPSIVKCKYLDRINYFKKRHPDLDYSQCVARNGYYGKQDIGCCDEILMMSSNFNAESLRKSGKFVTTINVNAIYNNNFIDNLSVEIIPQICRNFVLFGCNGLIHKGLDLLLDAFSKLPEYRLTVYGLSQAEELLFNKMASSNVKNGGFIQVSSEQFIREVVEKNLFVILPSCSEGMASGVATCMLHGLIPIVTKECGFEPASCIVELEDYNIQTITNTIKRVTCLNPIELYRLRSDVLKCAQERFSIQTFTYQFSNYLDKIDYVKSKNFDSLCVL